MSAVTAQEGREVSSEPQRESLVPIDLAAIAGIRRERMHCLPAAGDLGAAGASMDSNEWREGHHFDGAKMQETLRSLVQLVSIKSTEQAQMNTQLSLLDAKIDRLASQMERVLEGLRRPADVRSPSLTQNIRFSQRESIIRRASQRGSVGRRKSRCHSPDDVLSESSGSTMRCVRSEPQGISFDASRRKSRCHFASREAFECEAGERGEPEEPSHDDGMCTVGEVSSHLQPIDLANLHQDGESDEVENVASSEDGSPRQKSSSFSTGMVKTMSKVLAQPKNVFEMSRTGWRKKSDFAFQIWTLLEDPDSGRIAYWYSKMIIPFIILTVGLTVLQVVTPTQLWSTSLLEICFDAIFALELLLRYGVSPSNGVFFFNPYNIIDVLATMSLPARIAILVLSDDVFGTLLLRDAVFTLSPVIRLMKTLRHFEKFHIFVAVLRSTFEALGLLLFIQLVLVLFFSALIYLVEPRDNIPSLSTAIWLTIVTMTTVGYGDVTPASTLGTAVTAAIIISSILYMAMPIGIVGHAFTQIWSDRDRILLVRRTQDRLAQWGYVATDMPSLFEHYNYGFDGEMTFNEFKQMISEMRIFIGDERVAELFDSFDRSGSGTINVLELTRAMFPSTFHAIQNDSRFKSGIARPSAPEDSQSSNNRESGLGSEGMDLPRLLGLRRGGEESSEAPKPSACI